jgi:WD40 repeat protein
MSNLILKRATASPPSGEWNEDDFDVLAEGAVVGRIFKANAAPVGSPWMWSLAFGYHEDRAPTHGYAESRESVWSAAFSPDGKHIVTASRDRTARLWDGETGKPIGEPLTGHSEGLTSAAYSPDGKRIVTASNDRTARLWDAETGKPIGEPLRDHADGVLSAALSLGTGVCGLARFGAAAEFNRRENPAGRDHEAR